VSLSSADPSRVGPLFLYWPPARAVPYTWMGFHSPITNDYSDVWDECSCCCLHNSPLCSVWPTQFAADMGCNLRPLQQQWGDAMPPISREELVMNINQDINSVKVHPQLSHNGHPVDGTPVGARSLW
jgi:hypothetical protein